MATACDGVTTNQSGGKLRKKKPILRTCSPYDRPANRNNQPSLFSKLVNPASRLIYAGADRLFSVFRQRVSGTSEEPRNESQEAGPAPVSDNGIVVLEPNTDECGEKANISAITEISELENMLKQKSFTRSEIERLTTLLHSRTTGSDIEGDSGKLPITTSQVSRLEASTSGILKEHVKERKTVKFHVPVSTPITSSRAFEDDVATPAELAKAYMGTKSAKLSPLALRPSSQPSRQDPLLLNNSTVLPRTPVILLTPKPAAAFKTFDSCLTTPRSQGRSALYKNARSPYYRGTPTLSQKGVASPYALEQGSIELSRMGAKRRSSVIDDTGYDGPMRRIRQKVNLPSQQSSISKHKSEFGSSQKLFLRNEPEPKFLTPVEENVETSKCNLGYGSVPRESSRMASKIFEHLNKMSPKEKRSESRFAGTTEKINSPNFLSSSQDNKKSKGQHRVWLADARASTSQVNDVLSSLKGNYTEPSSSKITRSSVISQSTFIQKEPTVSQTFGTSASGVGPSGVKSNISPDAKSLGSTSFINSALNDNQVKSLASNKDVSGSTQEPVNLFGNSESSSSAHSTTASASDLFSFGGSSTTNEAPASTSSVFASSSSYQSSGSNTNQLSSSTSSHVFSSAATTTKAASSAFSSSVAASVAPTKPSASTFATSSNGGSIFSFSSPSATLATNGFQASTHAASTADTQAVPFKFESGTGGTGTPPSTTSGSSLFSSSAPSFGLSSAATTSSTTSLSGSGFNSTPGFGLSSTVASTESKSGSSTSGSTASIFGSTALQPPQSSFGSTPFSFGASSSSSAGTTQMPSPSSPAFSQDSGGKPSFMFGSGTPSTAPFQFSGHTNQPQTPSQNPFQASAGGFSLGSDGSVKSGRRILKVKRLNRRK